MKSFSEQRKKGKGTRLLILVALLGLAFALRIYRLDAVPLRGDEAFSVRYWAAAPGHVLRTLAAKEPHPLGAFFSFWAWKNTAGSSEFAMRYFPLLGNLIGVAAAAALGQQLFRDRRIAIFAAALWAVHPFQIWHAQDARNYAIWAGLSPLAMVLFLRALGSRRKRSWGLYVLVETAALYIFFLESFMVVVQAVYLLALRPARPVLRRAAAAWGVLGLLLIPWFVQLGYLARSGYQGTTEQANAAKLITWFLPTLFAGRDFRSPWDVIVPAAWGLLIMGLLWRSSRKAKPGAKEQDVTGSAPTEWGRVGWLAAWAVLPAGLLLIVSTHMSVFNPRYLIAVTPALLLLTGRAALLPPDSPAKSTANRVIRLLPQIAIGIIPLLGLGKLVDYYHGDNPKAPDWPALAVYLDHRAHPGDVIIQTAADPAFGYYYHGGVEEFSLIPGKDLPEQIDPALKEHPTIWLIGRNPEAEKLLNDQLQPVSFHVLSRFSIMQFRQWSPSEDEIAVRAGVTFGEIARLKGFTLLGPDPASRAITVLLYWEPLARSKTIDYKVFVHLIGPPQIDGSPLWDQEDHSPLYGFASTLAWNPGTLYRDPFHLLEKPSIQLPPGTYSIEVGFYDPATNARLPVFDANGKNAGDSYPLITFQWPVKKK